MEKGAKTILLVEDDSGLVDLLLEKIGDCGYKIAFVHSAHEAFKWLAENTPFLLILDFSLPDMNGREFIQELKKNGQQLVPFIISTGQGDERIAVDMMKLGARDYIIKDSSFLELIPLVISRIGKEIENENKLRLAEQALIESNQFNKQIIKSAGEGIIVYDLNMKYQVWNPFMEKMSGLPASEVLGKLPTDVFPFLKDAGVIENLKKVFKGETLHEIDFFYNVPSTGKSGWNADFTAPLLNAAGEIIGAIGTVRDITERYKNEQEIKLKNEELVKLNAEKDKFFSIIAHDLRSPFNAFLGFTKMMAEDLPSLRLDEIQEIAIEMRSSATNLFNLLENLLEWSRVRGGTAGYEPKKFMLAKNRIENLHSVLEAAKAKEIEVYFNLPEDIEVYADENMISSTFRNLISNAVKFTKKGGRITVSAKDAGNGIVDISVADSGIGMNTSLLQNLFRIDVQINRKGTEEEPSAGLGLLLCKEFVEKMGGEIWAESEEGKGTTFHFTIPKEHSIYS